MKWLLRVWLYGIPVIIVSACMALYFAVSNRDTLIYIAATLLTGVLIVVLRRATQLERSHGLDALPNRIQLQVAALLTVIVLLLMAFVAHWDIGQMRKFSGIFICLAAIPIAFVKPKNLVKN